MKTAAEAIFAEYLADVDTAARRLPGYARREILLSLRSHIAEATAERNVTTAEDARRLIAELGDPNVLVAEARVAEGTTNEDEEADVRGVLRWITLGSLIPFVGWFYGILRLWRSPAWTIRDKILGTVLIPGGFWGGCGAILAIASESGRACATSEMGKADGLGGVPVGTPTTSHWCQDLGALPTWLAVSLVLLVILAALAGPSWLRYRATPSSVRLVDRPVTTRSR